jgi:hypothetical protein
VCESGRLGAPQNLRFARDPQLRDSAVLFSLFSRRKKLASPGAESAPVSADPTDVVELLPAASVVTPAPVEIGERTPGERNAPEAEAAQPTVVEPLVVETTDVETAAAEPADVETAVVDPVVVEPAADSQPGVEKDIVQHRPVEAQGAAEALAAEAPSTSPPVPAVVRPPTVPELRAQAKALGLTGYSRLPKAELLRIIAEHHAK